MDTAILYPDEAEILGGMLVIDGATYTIYEDENDPTIYWIDSKHAKKVGKIQSRNIGSELMDRINQNNGRLNVVIKDYANWWDK